MKPEQLAYESDALANGVLVEERRFIYCKERYVSKMPNSLASSILLKPSFVSECTRNQKVPASNA